MPTNKSARRKRKNTNTHEQQALVNATSTKLAIPLPLYKSWLRGESMTWDERLAMSAEIPYPPTWYGRPLIKDGIAYHFKTSTVRYQGKIGTIIEFDYCADVDAVADAGTDN